MTDKNLFGEEVDYDGTDFIFEIKNSVYKNDLRNSFWHGAVIGGLIIFAACLFLGILDYVGIL